MDLAETTCTCCCFTGCVYRGLMFSTAGYLCFTLPSQSLGRWKMPLVQRLSSAHCTLCWPSAHSNSYHPPRQQEVQHGDILVQDDWWQQFQYQPGTGTLLLAVLTRRAKYSFEIFIYACSLFFLQKYNNYWKIIQRNLREPILVPKEFTGLSLAWQGNDTSMAGQYIITITVSNSY